MVGATVFSISSLRNSCDSDRPISIKRFSPLHASVYGAHVDCTAVLLDTMHGLQALSDRIDCASLLYLATVCFCLVCLAVIVSESTAAAPW